MHEPEAQQDAPLQSGPGTDEVRRQMDEIYSGQRLPLADIPWLSPQPPELLTALVDSGTVAPCRALELGCGVGHHALYLAGRGFTVTGVDLSRHAIELARANAARLGLACEFAVGDVLQGLGQLAGGYAFAYDWEVLHHFFPEQRPVYMATVGRLLNPGALYMSVSFSEHDPQFGGAGQVRTTRLGTRLYFAAVGEMRHVASPYFAVLDLREVELHTPGGLHVAVYALLQRLPVD